MRKLITILVLALAANANAQSGCDPGNPNYLPFTQESITVSTAAKILTVATYRPTDGGNATMAMISVEDADIRVWYTGTAPTATVGHLVKQNSFFYICSATLPRFQAIRDATTDAIISVTYLRPPQ